MKKKYADKRDVDAIITGTYKKVDIFDDDFYSAATLVDVFEVENKWKIPRKDGRLDVILDTAYKVETLFTKNENYAIEVYFNAKSEIVEFYFDIYKKANWKTEVPVREDLFLDVVITSRREVEFLDENELENAYKMGELNRKDYEMAKKTADKIVYKYNKTEELKKLIEASQKYLARLMGKKEGREINKKKSGGITEIEGIKELFGKGDDENGGNMI